MECAESNEWPCWCDGVFPGITFRPSLVNVNSKLSAAVCTGENIVIVIYKVKSRNRQAPMCCVRQTPACYPVRDDAFFVPFRPPPSRSARFSFRRKWRDRKKAIVVMCTYLYRKVVWCEFTRARGAHTNTCARAERVNLTFTRSSSTLFQFVNNKRSTIKVSTKNIGCALWRLLQLDA